MSPCDACDPCAESAAVGYCHTCDNYYCFHRSVDHTPAELAAAERREFARVKANGGEPTGHIDPAAWHPNSPTTKRTPTMTQTTTTANASVTILTKGQPKKARTRRNELPDLPSSQKTLGLDAQSVRPHYEIIKELAPFHVPIDKLRENPSNRGGVYDDAEIEAVARTLRVRQEDPIQVFAVDVDGNRLIHDGNVRFRAAKKAGLPSLLAIEIPPLNEADAAASRFVHNVRRSQLTPWQEALEFQAMRDHGYSEAQVATRAGVSEQLVRDRLRLVRLPPEVGRRIGEPGFGVAHAEAILPLVDHPKLMDAAASLIGKPERRGQRPPTADEFTRRVHEALGEKKLIATMSPGYDWRRDELLRTKPFQDRIKALPTVRIGSGEAALTLVLDRAKYGEIEKQAVEAVEKRDAAQAARDGPGASKPGAAARKKQLFEAKVRRVTRDRMHAAARKACKAQVQYGRPQLERAAGLLLGHVYLNAERLKTLSALVPDGITYDELRDYHRAYYAGQKTKRANQILAKAAKLGEPGLAHLTTALLLTEISDPDEWDQVVAPMVNTTWDKLEAKVRGELREQAAAKPARKAAAKRKDKPFNELVADCHSCGMRKVHTEPDGTLRRHWPKGKRASPCPVEGVRGAHVRPWRAWEPKTAEKEAA